MTSKDRLKLGTPRTRLIRRQAIRSSYQDRRALAPTVRLPANITAIPASAHNSYDALTLRVVMALTRLYSLL